MSSHDEVIRKCVQDIKEVSALLDLSAAIKRIAELTAENRRLRSALTDIMLPEMDRVMIRAIARTALEGNHAD